MAGIYSPDSSKLPPLLGGRASLHSFISPLIGGRGHQGVNQPTPAKPVHHLQPISPAPKSNSPKAASGETQVKGWQ
ncbi:hypothetical protein Dimus_000451, partial [Dionaea muscipula]